MCASVRASNLLSEEELRNYSTAVDGLFPELSLLEEDILYESLKECSRALINGTHRFSAQVLARLLFLLAEDLRKKEHARSICWMVYFCSECMFDLMLHQKDYYYNIAYAFYSVCETHEKLEGKGYFDVVKYIECRRGYNGMDIDFIAMTAVYARAAVDSKTIPYENHTYCKVLLDLYHDYRSITDHIPERYKSRAEALSLYRSCMRRVQTENDGVCPYIWPGMAYMVALYLGDYRKRLKIASWFGVSHLCQKTDLDTARRGSLLRRTVSALILLALGAFAYIKASGFYNESPLLFYGVMGPVVLFALLFLYMIAPVVTGVANPDVRHVYVINPWFRNWRYW